MHRIIHGLRPPAGTPLYEGGSLEEVLRRLARLILRAALMPMALALDRLMVTEAQRFPELAAIVAREGGRAEVIGQIAAMLDREARAGCLAINRPEFAVEQFLQLVVLLPQRRALGFGTPMTEAEPMPGRMIASICSQRLPLLAAEPAGIRVTRCGAGDLPTA
ncbi:MAG TPA: TetR/AcrR family transcriptional regulator C-terminal domain-containing protein [Xanthobacteraceae bacterium]|nr:TetR/AcrR family transcriptional regulator C-terminal domain-containing protein [Xanthobacteraceae bacterium]